MSGFGRESSARADREHAKEAEERAKALEQMKRGRPEWLKGMHEVEPKPAQQQP